MDDLDVPAGPGAPNGLRIPAGDLEERFSHASGPGGQGVNTTDSRVQLSVDLGTASGLTEAQRVRVLAALRPRLSGTVLSVTASEHRSQHRNRLAARARAAAILREALAPPAPRHSTRPTRGSQRRRLEGKKQRARLKQQRRRPGADSP